MEVYRVPNDVQLIVDRYIHRYKLNNINKEYESLENVVTYNYRAWDNSYRYTHIFSIHTNNVNVVTKLPKNYYYTVLHK